MCVVNDPRTAARMIMAGILCALLCALATVASADKRSDTADQRAAAEADALYAEGNYSKAYDKYLRLAKKGDTFSQYRSSYMSLMGEGTDVNYPAAFGWAVVAAESGDDNLFRYLQEVKALVPADQYEAAEVAAREYTEQWGTIALAVEARREADRKLRECTGSRLGTRCDEVYAMQMPKFWSIAPGAGDGTDGGSGAPSGSSSSSSFAMPKSSRRTCPAAVTNTFDGFRSRWMT